MRTSGFTFVLYNWLWEEPGSSLSNTLLAMQPWVTLETSLCFLLSHGSSPGNTTVMVSVVLTVPRITQERCLWACLWGGKSHLIVSWAGVLYWIKWEREGIAAAISCSLTADVEEDQTPSCGYGFSNRIGCILPLWAKISPSPFQLLFPGLSYHSRKVTNATAA